MSKLLNPLLLRAQKPKHLLPMRLQNIHLSRCMVEEIHNTHLVVYSVLSTITLFHQATERLIFFSDIFFVIIVSFKWRFDKVVLLNICLHFTFEVRIAPT